MTEVDVSVRNLTKRWGELAAVNNVSFDVPKGSFFSVLGPSASGKTTVLRMIAGFETPTAGDIFINGQRINDVPPNKRPCNLVFQRLALFPMMNVIDNVTFGLRRRGGMDKAEMERMANEVLARVDMKGLNKRKINEISGGQQQRVALARSLVLDPTVLLLDEPLSALDLKLRQDMKLELKRLQHRMGTTFMYITHDQTIALAMSDTVAVLNFGKLEQIASPEILYREPATHFVASFVGDNNRWNNGKVVDLVDEKFCRVDFGGILSKARMGEKLKPGDNVDLFIRPEMILLKLGKQQNGNIGKIKEINFDGSLSLVVVELLESKIPLSINVKLQYTEETPDLTIGDTVTLSWGGTTRPSANAFLHIEPPVEAEAKE